MRSYHPRGRGRSRQSPSMCCDFGRRGFTQIKPMNRSGGAANYRPDDVDLSGHPPACYNNTERATTPSAACSGF